MSLIAEFSLPTDDFVLGDALRLDEIDRIDFDCNIPARSDAMPYFWVWGSRFDEFEAAVESETAIEHLTLVDELDSNRLYRAEWRTRVSDLLRATRESNGVMQTVTGEHRWELEVLFESSNDLKAFSQYYSDTESNLTLDRLYQLHDSLSEECNLTPVQRETMIVAEKEGYYNEPSDISMEGLAEKLDVSLSAVSGRLRRGTSQLIRNNLL